MKFKKMQITYLLIAFITLSSGCTDVVKNNVSTQSIDTNLGNVFERIELNSTSEFISPAMRDQYEVVAANPTTFVKSASTRKMKLTVMDKDIELELKEIEIPNGVGNISLVNGPTVYASDIDDNTSIFQGHVVNSTGSNAWFIISRVAGNMNGQIDTGNESYHIWSTGETYNEKPIWIIYLSQPQYNKLTFTAIPEKTTVNKGEETDITFILTNVGNNTLNVWKMEEQLSYDISIDSLLNKKPAEYICGISSLPVVGDSVLVELKPGESLKSSFSTDCWILNPGEYRLSANYHTGSGEIHKPYWRGSIKSNEVLIKISDSINYSAVHILPSYNATASEWLKTNASFVAQIVLNNSTAQRVIESGGTIIGVINFCSPSPSLYSGAGCTPALVIRVDPYTYTFSVNESTRKVIYIGVEIPRY